MSGAKRVPESTFLFRIVNWERYVPYNSKIAIFGALAASFAATNLALAAFENEQRRKAKKADAKRGVVK